MVKCFIDKPFLNINSLINQMQTSNATSKVTLIFLEDQDRTLEWQLE